jgi:hypothetical protein
MPIEIKELTIKAYINDAAKPQTPAQKMPESSGNNSTEMIIAVCVEQVLQVLKDKEER